MSAPRLAVWYAVGVVVGVVLLVVVFTWTIVDTYQSVDVPSTPLVLRLVATGALYALMAGGLAFVSRDGTWEWGLRIALPTIVVLGIAALLDGVTTPDALRGEALIFGLVAAGCGGSWLGASLSRGRPPGRPPRD